MKKKLILLALPALLWGCNPKGTSQEEQTTALEAEVMGIHDEAMAKMGDLYKMRRNLRTLRDTLATKQTDSTTLEALQRQIDDLNKADEVMMVWMRNYQAPDSLQAAQAQQYLKQELQKITRVQVVMDSTLQAAQKLYTTYE